MAVGKIIFKEDIPDSMEAEVIATEILGLARPLYVLRNLTRVIQFDGISGKVPIATKLSGTEKVKAGVEAPINGQAYTDVDFDLWKNVVHIAVSLEATLKSKFNIIQLQTTDASKAVAKMEDDQVAVVVATLTAISGTDWATATNDPLYDIRKAIAAIEDEGYEPDAIAMSRSVYSAFVSNPFVRESYERGQLVQGQLPSILGLTLYLSTSITAKTAAVVDTTAPCMALADGPMAVENYNKDGAFVQGWAMGKFVEPKLVLSAAGRQLTGLLP